jgi:hypothetical protein
MGRDMLIYQISWGDRITGSSKVAGAPVNCELLERYVAHARVKTTVSESGVGRFSAAPGWLVIEKALDRRPAPSSARGRRAPISARGRRARRGTMRALVGVVLLVVEARGGIHGFVALDHHRAVRGAHS